MISTIWRNKPFAIGLLFVTTVALAMLATACPLSKSLVVGSSPNGRATADCEPNCERESPWTATVTAVADSGYEFAGWACSGSCPPDGAISSVRITINENTHIAPIFREAKSASLNLGSAPNGRVTADCEPNCDREPPWTANVTAVADSGYEFDSWNCTGSCPSISSGPSVRITINENTQITPVFSKIPTARLNLGSAPNGRVTADCEPNCDRDPPWTANVTAVADSGYEFDSWNCTGSCPSSGSGPSVRITINEDTHITPVFREVPVSLSLGSTPNGSVTADCEPNCSQVPPWVATVTARADRGYDFDYWNCSGSCPSSSSGPSVRITINQDTRIAPVFREVVCTNADIVDVEAFGEVGDGGGNIGISFSYRKDCNYSEISGLTLRPGDSGVLPGSVAVNPGRSDSGNISVRVPGCPTTRFGININWSVVVDGQVYDRFEQECTTSVKIIGDL